jgi:hypothetical protein
MRHHSKMAITRTALLLGFTLPLPACISWSSARGVEPVEVPPNTQYKVWTADQVLWLRAVQITPDTLSGIPFKLEATCTNCRVSIPLGEVDSIRVGIASTSKTLILIGVGVLIPFVVAAVYAGCC